MSSVNTLLLDADDALVGAVNRLSVAFDEEEFSADGSAELADLLYREMQRLNKALTIVRAVRRKLPSSGKP
jgi:hypothetical protein